MARRISLIVDDEPAVRTYIRIILERECFETVEAGGGNHGLAILKDLGSQVGLIVSDVQMPEGDGISFARAAASSFPEVPIILISGYASSSEVPAFEFLEKPFSPDSLLRAVRKVVTAKAA
jgi:two-component system, cell cycle sensor histidine kinase and response regulator CckA